MIVKSAFVVDTVTKNRYGGESVKFTAVAVSEDKELNSFADATPSGSIEIYIRNKAIAGHYVPGDIHYVTFEKREAPTEK